MKKPPKTHFHAGGMAFTTCGLNVVKGRLVSDDIKSITCVTCGDKYKRDLNANLRTVAYIVQNSVVGGEEMMALLHRSFTDAAEMNARSSVVGGICNLVQLGVIQWHIYKIQYRGPLEYDGSH